MIITVKDCVCICIEIIGETLSENMGQNKYNRYERKNQKGKDYTSIMNYYIGVALKHSNTQP